MVRYIHRRKYCLARPESNVHSRSVSRWSVLIRRPPVTAAQAQLKKDICNQLTTSSKSLRRAAVKHFSGTQMALA